MIAGRWYVTEHALRRYVERTRQVTEDRARQILADERARSAMLGELIPQTEGAHLVATAVRRDGCKLWRGPKPRRLRFVVGPGEGHAEALVTVLDAFDGRGVSRRGEGP